MTKLSFSRAALADGERLAVFLMERDPEGAASTLALITNAVEVLRRHPFIGRPVEGGLRELIISRDRTGYVALYEFGPNRDEIIVHKLRHQLEAGYTEW